MNTVASRLFPGFRNRSTTGRTAATRKKMNGGSWTAQLFCVSAKDQIKTPTCTEKEILNKSGLGLKKMKINNSLNEEEVIQLLQSEQGYPKLQDSGGFELLRTLQNGRNLVVVPGPWTSKGLKMNVGPQARIYIRPIQHSLSVEPVVCDQGPSVKVLCDKCKGEFSVHELRNHVQFCAFTQSDTVSDISELTDSSFAESGICTDVTESNNGLLTQPNLMNQENGAGDTEFFIFFPDAEEAAGSQPSAVLEASESSVLETSQGVGDSSGLEASQSVLDASTLNVSESESESLDYIVQCCISFCQENKISNPVEMLRKIQELVVTGRPLEVEDSTSSIEGETNFITVNRHNLLETSLEEICSLPASELRKTLEVQFYNEV